MAITETTKTTKTTNVEVTAGDESAKASRWKRAFSLREMGVYYALILLIAVLAFATTYIGRSNYLSVINFTNVLYQSALIGTMAMAMTVILITGNFDLSVASVAALAGAVLIGTADMMGFWPAFMLAMSVALVCGLVNGLVVQLIGINAFIVTLGTLTAIRGLVLIYTDGRSLSVRDPEVIASMKWFEGGRHDVGLFVLAVGVILALAGLWRTRRKGFDPTVLGLLLGGGFLVAISALTGFKLRLPNPVIYLAIIAVVLWGTLNFTILGRRIYAVGGNAEAARFAGINVFRYKIGAFLLCSGAAGFAGVLFASRLRSINPTALQGDELTVIASAILGGTALFGGSGSVVKTLAGTLLLYSLTNGFNILNLGANYQGLIEGLVVVAAAAIYTIGGQKKS